MSAASFTAALAEARDAAREACLTEMFYAPFLAEIEARVQDYSRDGYPRERAELLGVEALQPFTAFCRDLHERAGDLVVGQIRKLEIALAAARRAHEDRAAARRGARS